MESINNKRRKQCIDPSDCSIISINNLTEDNLIAISKYLPKTSRALFAVALTAPSSSYRQKNGKPSCASKAIISAVQPTESFTSIVDTLCKKSPWPLRRPRPQGDYYFRRSITTKQIKEYYDGGYTWEMLDFVDIGRTLASKLTDDDLYAMLVCINAQHNLKRLNLTHCFNIIGYGLQPLRSSTTFEKLDLGLGQQCEIPNRYDLTIRNANREAKISEEIIFGILDSILNVEGNAFKRLQVHGSMWEHQDAPGYDSETDDWGDDPPGWYNRRRISPIPSIAFKSFLKKHNNHVLNGQSSCCYFGLSDDEELKHFLTNIVEKSSDIVDTCIQCGSMDFHVCIDCHTVYCGQNNDTCQLDILNWCQECPKVSCNACDPHTVDGCDPHCGMDYCNDCRDVVCRDGTNTCTACKGMVYDRLLEEKNRLEGDNSSKQAEIDRLNQLVQDLQLSNGTQKSNFTI